MPLRRDDIFFIFIFYFRQLCRHCAALPRLAFAIFAMLADFRFRFR